MAVNSDFFQNLSFSCSDSRENGLAPTVSVRQGHTANEIRFQVVGAHHKDMHKTRIRPKTAATGSSHATNYSPNESINAFERTRRAEKSLDEMKMLLKQLDR